MKTIDASKVLFDLNNKPLAFDPADTANHATVGKIMALIFQAYKGKAFGNDPLKALELAREFHKGKTVSLDKSDFGKLRVVLQEDQQFTPIVLGQIVEELDSAEKAVEKK